MADKERYGYDATSQPFQKQTEIRYVSDGQFSLESGIDLYGNEKVSIVIFTEHEMMGMIIKSKTLYATLSALFNLIWNHASHGK
ncbi:MAG: hypothetical protein LBD75_07570 [Candidatus Peribacteria bacterium]|nr:hypothetical protein [Candidatus Peribacteria bacterium]